MTLIYTVPYLDLFMNCCKNINQMRGNYNKALGVLFESLKYQKQHLHIMWIGKFIYKQ
jgi:hypothetical protein